MLSLYLVSCMNVVCYLDCINAPVTALFPGVPRVLGESFSAAQSNLWTRAQDKTAVNH